MWAAFFYILAVLCANLSATLFLPFEIAPGTGILVSVGTLIFGITFTQRDRMHSRGRRFVYSVIALSAVLNLIMLMSYRFLWGEWLLSLLAEAGWNWFEEGAAMLMDTGWRVFVASFVAIVIAESADTEIFQMFRHKTWVGRVFRSNLVSIPLDSILFNVIAFSGSSFFSPIIVLKVILGEILSKFAVGISYALLLPRKAERKDR